MIGIELLVVLCRYPSGGPDRQHRYRLCRWSGVLVLTWGLGMPIPSDQLVTYLPWDVIMIIASVICAIAWHAAGRRDGLSGAPGRKSPAQESQAHHFLPRRSSPT